MSLQTPPPIVKRIAITLSLGVAFIVMASVFSPERSRAGEDTQRRGPKVERRDRAPAAVSVDAHEGLRSLGVIESGQYSIAIFATGVGPRYTIVENTTGDEIGTLLSAEQVQKLLPEIDITSLDFSAPSDQQPLMLAEPRGGAL